MVHLVCLKEISSQTVRILFNKIYLFHDNYYKKLNKMLNFVIY
jgi:hypothetical protein